MQIVETKLPGVFFVETDAYEDERGSFVKTFHENIFKNKNIGVDFRESFYSVSKKDVIRGMHFHLPPKAHAKLIYVTSGSILDVVLDLRVGSPTYGQYESIIMSQKNRKMTHIPVGCAHGFLALEDNTCTVYLQSDVYSKEHDAGIHIDSFGMDWQIENPILSKRDKEFESFDTFNSPFIYNETIN